METVLNSILNVITEVLSNGVVQGAIVTMLVGLLGRANLQRIPVFGVFIRILGDTIDAYLARAEAARIEAGVQTAEILVEGQEQLRKIGKVDGPTAAATVATEVARVARVSSDTARQITEAAVRQLPASQFNK